MKFGVAMVVLVVLCVWAPGMLPTIEASRAGGRTSMARKLKEANGKEAGMVRGGYGGGRVTMMEELDMYEAMDIGGSIGGGGAGVGRRQLLQGGTAEENLVFESVSAGFYHTCGITTDGSGYCWGYNEYGQLGDGTNISRSLPVAIANGQYKWSSIFAGGGHTCGVTTDGSGYCWGYNDYGQLGDDGTETDRYLPIAIANGQYNWSSIDVGGAHTCGITTDGSGYCWGNNYYGELGDGTDTDRSLPVAIADGQYKWSSIDAGSSHTCGITTDGSGYCWGDNYYGELGHDDTETDRFLPVAIANGQYKWSLISAGEDHTCGITTDGSGYCWGWNGFGQLGDGTETDRSLPVEIADGQYKWSSIDARYSHTCGITTDSSGYCWGYNGYGQIGNDTSADIVSLPVENFDGLLWSTISAGGYHTCGITTDGSGYCWGDNGYGQLGDGTKPYRSLPVAIADGQYQWSSISAGDNHTCGVTTDSSGYCWGSNEYAQLGDGTGTDQYLPVEIDNGQYKWSSISVGGAHTCGITTDGSGYCWGRNGYGRLGDGTETYRSLPVAIADGQYKWSSISPGDYHTCGVITNSSGYCWGHNRFGQLGDGTETDRFLPVAIADGKYKWSLISTGGDNTCGITTDGSGYCWGYYEYVQLGDDGTETDRLLPVEIANGKFKWSSISAGDDHICGITTDGSGYCWGQNVFGQLGDGTNTYRSLPVGIADGLYKWSSIDVGNYYHTCGITTDGSGYCWGYNVNGELGDGTETDRSLPVEISDGQFKWVSIDAGDSHTCGITKDGSGYCWGDNEYGQMGSENIDANYLVLFSKGDSSTNKSSNAALIGGVVGGVVGALLLAGVGFFLYRKRRNRRSKRLGIDSSACLHASDMDLKASNATVDGAIQTQSSTHPQSEIPITRPCTDSILLTQVASRPQGLSPPSTSPFSSPPVPQVSTHEPRSPAPGLRGSLDAVGIAHPIQDAELSDEGQRGAVGSRNDGTSASVATHATDSTAIAAATRSSTAMGSSLSRESEASRPSTAPSLRESGPFIKTFEESEFDIEECIGQGSFGRVFRARWRRTEVAFKALGGKHGVLALSASDLEALGRELEKEASLMAELRHPNIVQFLGICVSPPCLVTEFCARGSLTALLREARESTTMAAQLSWSRRLSLLTGAARGVLYLHSNKPHAVLHRDLKSPNILVTEEWTAKVGDFGLSRVLGEYHARSTIGTMANNPRWLSPEVLGGATFTSSSDVFSFGVIMWEVLTCDLPWRLTNEWAIVNSVREGGRLAVPPMDEVPGPRCSEDLFAGYVRLMTRCWSQDPESRPAFEGVVDELESLREMVG